jgi:chemotaxis protein MotB
MRRRDPSALFPVSVWPPFVDALTLVLAAFVLMAVVWGVSQRGLIDRLRRGESELERLRADKERMERRLRALASATSVAVEDGKVIVQGELLFASGSEELSAAGKTTLQSMAKGLRALVEESADEMILIGGHTDDVPISNARFASNWELSAARATAVARELITGGVPPTRIVAAGFGPHHPRTTRRDVDSRRQNRRIEVLLVPVHSVASR